VNAEQVYTGIPASNRERLESLARIRLRDAGGIQTGLRPGPEVAVRNSLSVTVLPSVFTLRVASYTAIALLTGVLRYSLIGEVRSYWFSLRVQGMVPDSYGPVANCTTTEYFPAGPARLPQTDA